MPSIFVGQAPLFLVACKPLANLHEPLEMPKFYFLGSDLHSLLWKYAKFRWIIFHVSLTQKSPCLLVESFFLARSLVSDLCGRLSQCYWVSYPCVYIYIHTYHSILRGMMLHYIISYPIISYHVISYHITFYHIIS